MQLIPCLTLAALIATSASTAKAEGFYIKAYGGVSNIGETDITILGGGTDTDVSFGSGTTFGGSVGYTYPGTSLSAELEYTYRSGDSDTGTTADGDFASTALMVNAVYALGQTGAITPYVGGGLGVLTEIDFDVPSGGGEVEYSDRGGLAGQLFTGASYAITERTSVFGQIRYFDAGSRTLTSDGGATLDTDYSTIDVTFGASFRF
ncbi:MAG: porin family protein [Silicimonas sp.]|nr:porin family protein [Silicimonas sp.]